MSCIVLEIWHKFSRGKRPAEKGRKGKMELFTSSHHMIAALICFFARPHRSSSEVFSSWFCFLRHHCPLHYFTRSVVDIFANYFTRSVVCYSIQPVLLNTLVQVKSIAMSAKDHSRLNKILSPLCMRLWKKIGFVTCICLTIRLSYVALRRHQFNNLGILTLGKLEQ